MKTWKNFETNNPNVKEYLRVWLKLNEIRFEISECFDGWHFEILCDDMECEDVNRFLDELYR
jgi:hypothetical protein